MIAEKFAQNEVSDLICRGQEESYALGIEDGTGRTDSPTGLLRQVGAIFFFGVGIFARVRRLCAWSTPDTVEFVARINDHCGGFER